MDDRSKDPKWAPLTVKLDGGKITIEIGIHTLGNAAAFSDWANPFDDAKNDYRRTFAIADIDEFAKDVRRALLDEAEDGSSLLSNMLDKAMENAINDGSLGLAMFDADIAYGQFADVELWAK